MTEKTLVLIKPDAMIKQLAGNIISDLYKLNLEMIGLKLVNVQKELAEAHYEEHKGKKFYEGLIDYITGKLHDNENVIAIVYQGEKAIQKIREFIGETNPDRASPKSIRGKYGKVHTEKNNWHETVLHASDSIESAKREIDLWFDKKELINHS
ncbi:MAG: nucleoside-diphosphate kinase [Nanoarchaeota archaeon]|nr:nucleoside-diphosphate kinase [Nanoarchaeota archaeon]